jgi:hypothetical protein
MEERKKKEYFKVCMIVQLILYFVQYYHCFIHTQEKGQAGSNPSNFTGDIGENEAKDSTLRILMKIGWRPEDLADISAEMHFLAVVFVGL